MNLEIPPPETAPVEEKIEAKFVSIIDLQKEVEHFLDARHSAILGERVIADAKEKATVAEKNINEKIRAGEINTGEKEVTYNKYKKSLFIEGEQVTLGQIVASRHFAEQIKMNESTAKTFEGRKLLETFTEYKTRDVLTESLNKDLAQMLADKTKREDLFKSKAYGEIAKREGKDSEQLGVVAEKMMQGIAEMIALDRSDLHLEIRPANAYQDVEEKIDFIISTKHKKRGVGIETNEGTTESEYDEKNFGIQFTINTSKTAHKMEQIEKAKARTTDMDDILLVSIDQNIISRALAEWEKTGQKIHGPWNYIPSNSKKKIIETLFSGVLKSEEIESLKRGL